MMFIYQNEINANKNYILSSTVSVLGGILMVWVQHEKSSRIISSV